ncbi:hypothetical protein ACC703_39040, partial [Rhizobium ruizarguesonis]
MGVAEGHVSRSPCRIEGEGRPDSVFAGTYQERRNKGGMSMMESKSIYDRLEGTLANSFEGL